MCQITSHDTSGLGIKHLLLPLLSVFLSVSAGVAGAVVLSLVFDYQLHARLANLLVPGGATAAVLTRWVGKGGLHESALV